MKTKNAIIVAVLSFVVGMADPGFRLSTAMGQTPDASQPAIAKSIGTIKTINGNAITLAPETGADVAVTVAANARLLRMTPGDKELKNAAPIQLTDLQVGDKVRVRGRASANGIEIGRASCRERG